jgi:hypothetical protein
MDAVAVWTLLLHVVWTPVPWNVRETAAVVVSVTFDHAEDCREARRSIDEFAPLVMAVGGLWNGAARAMGGCVEEARVPDAAPALGQAHTGEDPGVPPGAAARWAGRIRSLDVRPATEGPVTTARTS